MRSLVGSIVEPRVTNLATTPVPYVGRHFRTFGASTDARSKASQTAQYGANGTLFGVVDRLSTSTAQVGWQLYRKAKSGKPEDRTVVASHAALDLWNSPNPFYTQFELVQAVQQHVDLTGEGWILVVRHARASIPIELWPIRPDRIKPNPDPDKFCTGYTYFAPDGDEIQLGLQDIIRLKMPDPDNPYRGMGPVQALMRTLDRQRFSEEWNRNFFVNNAEPGGIIEVEERLGDDEFNEFRDRWAESHQGVGNAHRVAILENGMKWVERKYSVRDMQFAELEQIGPDKIREAYGFPKFAQGIVEDVNRASAEASDAMFGKWLASPRLRRWKDALTVRLLPMFGATATGLEFDHDNPVPPDQEQENANAESKATTAETYIRAGFTGDSVKEALQLPDALVWEKPAPPAPGGAPGAAPADGQEQAAADGDGGEPTTAQEDLDWGLFGGDDGDAAENLLRRLMGWNPADHPRDRRGRFTKSRTAKLTDAEIERGRAVMANFKPKKFSSDTEVATYLKGGPKLPSAQAAAVERYTGDGFFEMNKQLRASGEPTDPDIARLRSAMKPLEDDLILTRTVGLEAFGKVPIEELVGHKVKDAAFSSTSLNAVYGGGLSGVTMQIAVPKGTLAVLAAKYSRNPSEREILLADGLEFAVASVQPNGLGGYKMSLIVLPSAGTAEDRLAGDFLAHLRNTAEEDDLQQVQDDWEAALAALLAVWAGVTAAQRAELAAQILLLVNAGDVAGLAALTASSDQGSAVLAAALTAMATTAAATATAEAAAQGVEVGAVGIAAGDLAIVAAAVAGLLAAGLATAAGKEAVRLFYPGASGDEVAQGVTRHLEGLSDAYLREQLGGILTRAQNVGRLTAFQAAEAVNPQVQYAASEVLDKNTCKPCRMVDGTQFPAWIDAWDAYAGGSYRGCLGGVRCRGTVVATWIGGA